MSRVVLAMSGGVDSSVAVHLLREAGLDVSGVFMCHGQNAADDQSRGTTDADDARRVAEMLDIPFQVVHLKEEFQRIVDYFCDEYAAGRTPNPCLVCNRHIKFGKLFDYADDMGAEFFATGHYARVVPTADGQVALCRGRDETKDQAYALFNIDRKVLPRLKLPVGEHRKEEIRKIAEQLGLPVAGKRDSQEICFVPDRGHVRFVRGRRPGLAVAGEIVTTDGTVVGRHDGFERFTIGQRKGLHVAMGEPYFVVRIEPDTRRIVIGTRDELAQTELTAGELNWLVDPPTEPLRCQVKIRYRSRLEDATVTPLPGNRFHCRFDRPRHGIAPGQAAVCYDGDRVLGGGWIE